MEPLDLPRLGQHHDDLWTTLCDLGDAHDEDWVIIGGQMVMLHALEAGREPGRVSQDLDTVIDARVRPPALPAFLATLANLGSHRPQSVPTKSPIAVNVDPCTLTSSARTGSVAAPTYAQLVARRPSKWVAAPGHCNEPNESASATAIEWLMCRGQTCSAPSSSRPLPSTTIRIPNAMFAMSPSSVRSSPSDACRHDRHGRPATRAATVLNDLTNEAWQLLDDAELGYTAFRILVAGSDSTVQ